MMQKCLLATIGLLLCNFPAFSQSSYSFGTNLGSLNYSVSISQPACYIYAGGNDAPHYYTVANFFGFVYVNSNGNINQPIGGSLTTITGSPGPGQGTSDTCPKNVPTASLPTYNGTGYSLQISATDTALGPTIQVPGYINPKYVVVGMIYAPPGGVVSSGVAKGNVDYTNSNLLSSTVTAKSSFGISNTETQVIPLPSFGFNIVGWANGSVTGSSTSSYTTATTTTDSTAVTFQKVSGTEVGVNGPLCPYVGVDHDYDILEVWVNPVELFTVTGGGHAQPNGYGYSTLDQPGLDIYPVYAGELNGDLSVRASTKTAFARSWAAGEEWPSGQGPGLTATDEQNILKLDPYWDCKWSSPWTDSGTTACAKPPDPTRFTESGGDQNFPYTQPAAGDSPSFKTYHFAYTDTDTQGLDVLSSTSQTFAIEKVYSLNLPIFGLSFKDTLTKSSTISHSYETSSQFTSSNTTTAMATIWQPPCNVVDGACNPVYPPAHAYNPVSCKATTLGQAFGQGDSMYIYQDNLFGTFLMEPYGK